MPAWTKEAWRRRQEARRSRGVWAEQPEEPFTRTQKSAREVSGVQGGRIAQRPLQTRAKNQNNKLLEALHDDPNITRGEVIDFTKDLQEEGKLAKQAAQNALDDNNNAIAVMESETRLEIATVVRKYNHTKTTRKLEILDGAAKVEARNKKNKGDHHSNKDAH